MSLFWFQFIVSAFLFWVGVYLVSRNIRSKTAWVIFFFLFSLSWYILVVDAITPLFTDDQLTSVFLYHLTNWSYILPIPLLLHFALLVTQNYKKSIWIQLWFIYFIAILLIILSSTSNLVIDYSSLLISDESFGEFYKRGPLFNAIALIVVWAMSASLYAYITARSKVNDSRRRTKFLLPIIASVLYIISGLFLVYVYQTDNYFLAVYSTSPLLIVPVFFIAVSIFHFGLISDIEGLFEIKEFIYLSCAIALITLLPAMVFSQHIIPEVGRNAQAILGAFVFFYIFSHSFYDWFTTFLRDLLYNTGKGFSLITDSDVSNLIKDFHVPEKLEVNPLTKFKMTKQAANNGKLVDAAQAIVREAIEYFKQSDYPRRTKQNLKYQMLKMLALDSAEEGQILWELGFDGYPMKILAGENQTRKPLFKIESMSDYTATSRNAFIALKKEAIHDLAWRLSYLERHSN